MLMGSVPNSVGGRTCRYRNAATICKMQYTTEPQRTASKTPARTLFARISRRWISRRSTGRARLALESMGPPVIIPTGRNRQARSLDHLGREVGEAVSSALRILDDSCLRV